MSIKFIKNTKSDVNLELTILSLNPSYNFNVYTHFIILVGLKM